MMDLTLVCHYATRERVERNLLASLEGQWHGPTILQANFPSLGSGYAAADFTLRTPLGLYVHDDVYLCPDFFVMLERAVTSIAAMDPQWGLLGVMGTFWEQTQETATHVKREQRYHGHVWDSTAYRSFGCLYTARQVATLDGCVVLKRKDVGEWDANIPGFHGAVEDLCLQIHQMRRNIWSVGIPIVHNSKLPNVDIETDLGYLAAKAYVMNKWPNVRPIVTPSAVWR